MRLIDDLINIVEKEFHLLGSLLNLVLMAKKIIIANKKDQLKENLVAQEKFIKDISACEIIRQNIIINIACELNIPTPEKLNLENLINFVPEPLNLKLVQLKTMLIERIKNIKQIRDRNSLLIQHALNYISFSLEAFSDAINTSQKNEVYSPYGSRMFNPSDKYQLLNYNA